MEKFKELPLHKDYWIGDCGTILSKKHNKKYGRKLMKRISNRYWTISIDSNFYKVSRLVYITWHGKLKKGYIINHIDGDRLNDCKDNLEQITYKQNIRHAHDVLKIKKRYSISYEEAQYVINNPKIGAKTIHEKWGIAIMTVYRIRKKPELYGDPKRFPERLL